MDIVQLKKSFKYFEMKNKLEECNSDKITLHQIIDNVEYIFEKQITTYKVVKSKFTIILKT